MAERATVLSRAMLSRWALPPPERASDKDSRGCVLVVAGSRPMPGAAILAANAALRAGAGKVQLAVPRSIAIPVGCHVAEAYVHGVAETSSGEIAPSALRDLTRAAKTADAVLVGPAMNAPRGLAQLVIGLLRSLREDQVVVLDAGALTSLANQSEVAQLRCQLCITPHAGEMATLCGVDKRAVEARPLHAALRMADEMRAVVVLKGRETFITDGKARLVNRAGNAGLATSGSGDTLSGILAGLAARGAPLLHAAAWSVFLHAKAGDRLAREIGPVGYLPRELLSRIPRLMR